ncbi:ROK family protein [Naumannella halotolerans]|uniref:Glucokinase n=1 Tax=Naumannella halotolerans TaxID=993414 RepID=A0A4R7JBH8_9ACTN|nr:ROK family protein [Naumannella halotolerans]TDT33789.1 glucokinase [Naumannella halotolerans]
MAERVLAVDIGGTKVALAVVDATGRVMAERVVPTLQAGAEEIFAPIGGAIAELVSDWPGELRIGIGSAGPIDSRNGAVSPVNIGAWRNYPIVERVRDAARWASGHDPATVKLIGDGHAIALGEYWLGAGRDVESMIGMVVSTGVGGGAVINNELFTGTTGNAVHIGHTSINFLGELCVCGNRGCVELYARGPALAATARDRGLGVADAKELTQLARDGDPVALEVIDQGMRALAQGIVSAAVYLDVPVVVLGGGVSKAGAVIFDPLRRHVAEYAVLSYVTDLEVRRAELDNAGLLGAAALAHGEVELR